MPMSATAPTNPSSSPTTAKMKSAYRTRRKCSWLCVPLRYPRPVSPPEPMLISACETL